MLNLADDVAALAKALVDIPSVSGAEGPLADMVEAALRGVNHLEVTRVGDTVVASTSCGRAERVIIAGHLDTVPVADNVPGQWQQRGTTRVLAGRGAVDMKSGVAVQLHLAAALDAPVRDVTWIFYDHEEVEAAKNGLGALAAARPDLLAADIAILMEPSDGVVEGGCQGTLRVRLTTHGLAAHSARSWTGHNAIHDLAGALEILNQYEPATVVVEGLAYREGLNAVRISGGVAGNVIPASAHVDVNYRFAPDKDIDAAEVLLRDLFAGFDLTVIDAASGARPGLATAAVATFVEAVALPVRPKYGWTDVARFAALGIPAVNFGPGDPNLAHTPQEYIVVDDIVASRDALYRWLTR